MHEPYRCHIGGMTIVCQDGLVVVGLDLIEADLGVAGRCQQPLVCGDLKFVHLRQQKRH